MPSEYDVEASRAADQALIAVEAQVAESDQQNSTSGRSRSISDCTALAVGTSSMP